MNWEAVGAIGEIVGATGVIVSLVYLAAQIRHSNRQVDEQSRSSQLASAAAVARGFADFRRSFIHDSELTAIWVKGGNELDELTPEERLRFDYSAVELFWSWAMVWLYTQQGVFDPIIADQTMKNLELYVTLPGIRKWWFESGHRAEYPEGFASDVDTILKKKHTLNV